MTFQPNICMATDFYKLTHWKQYTNGLTRIYSYGEAREGAYFNETVWTGLLPILKDFFEGQVVTQEKIDQAELWATRMGGYKEYFNREMWQHILDKYDGKIPIVIKALPEGSVVPPSTPLFTVDCLDDKCVAVVNHCETILMHMWSATTVASATRFIQKHQLKCAEKTGTPEIVQFMLHDFGFRGVSSFMTAIYAGMAVLTVSSGTDTTEAVRAISHFYGDDVCYGFSVWATEHSTATSYGPDQGEYDYVNAQLDNAPDDAIISLVGDSYDIFNFCKVVLNDPVIKAKIIARKGRFVVRPDSGKPMFVVQKILNILGAVFGTTYNDKGYKVINHNVGVLQGDGMDHISICELYDHIILNDWSSDNLVVGSGGGLLQKWNRDTQRFAIKASYGEINGVGFDIFKDPVTANSGEETKKSKRGRLKVQSTGVNSFTTINSNDPAFDSYIDSMETIFDTGEVINPSSFTDVRKRAAL